MTGREPLKQGYIGQRYLRVSLNGKRTGYSFESLRSEY